MNSTALKPRNAAASIPELVRLPQSERPSASRRLCLASLALALAANFTTGAAPLPFASPEDVGMSGRKLREVESAVGEQIDQHRLAGAVTLVLRRGHIVHFEAHGWKNIAAREPMTTETLFRIYSMTKPIVSVALMTLQEQGRFELDDPVDAFIPELKGLKVYAPTGNVPPRRPITIRDLLRHTAGFTYGFFGDSPVDKQYLEAGILSPTNDSAIFISKVAGFPLRFQPGERWVYSIAVDVQGILIERLTGQSLDRALQERIFEPLGMVDTGFHVPPEKRHRLAANYSPDGQGGWMVNDDPATSPYRFPPRFYSGGGGLVSTAADYARFVQMLLNGGELFGVRILKPETVQAMTRNQLPDSAYPISINGDRPGVGFGLGFAVRVEKSDWDPDARPGEYGWDGAASTHFWVSPQDELAVITLEQTMPYTWHVAKALKGLIYDAVER